jgi:streptogramin lyase
MIVAHTGKPFLIKEFFMSMRTLLLNLLSKIHKKSLGGIAYAVFYAGFLASAHAAPFTINEFPLAGGSFPDCITSGPDGNLWVTEESGKIAQMAPDGTILNEFDIPSGTGNRFGITTGPDGNLWFTENFGLGGGKIGKITPAGAISEIDITSVVSGGLTNVSGITAGPDGNLWVTNTDLSASKIIRIPPDTDANCSSCMAFITPTGVSDPNHITMGPDGNLWFTERSGRKIGRITPNGSITEFPPSGNTLVTPAGITLGPDGNLWFAEQSASANYIGRITTNGVITEFPTPTFTFSFPTAITFGPDRNLWFTESNNLGRVTGDTNIISEIPAPDVIELIACIATGPDGNIWFNMNSVHKIGQLVLPHLSMSVSNSGNVTEPSAGGTSTAVFTVSLSQAISDTVTVNFSTEDGTASAANVDYIPTSGQLIFNPGETNKFVPVTINNVDDDTAAAAETPETFDLVLSQPEFASFSLPFNPFITSTLAATANIQEDSNNSGGGGGNNKNGGGGCSLTPNNFKPSSFFAVFSLLGVVFYLFIRQDEKEKKEDRR